MRSEQRRASSKSSLAFKPYPFFAAQTTIAAHAATMTANDAKPHAAPNAMPAAIESDTVTTRTVTTMIADAP